METKQEIKRKEKTNKQLVIDAVFPSDEDLIQLFVQAPCVLLKSLRNDEGLDEEPSKHDSASAVTKNRCREKA